MSLRTGSHLPQGGLEATRAAWQAVLITLLAWAALLCAGLGGNAGGVSQTLAGKLAASAQHLQRHGGTSLSSRAVRRDTPAAASGLNRAGTAAVAAAAELAEVAALPAQAAAVSGLHADSAVPATGAALPAVRWPVAHAAQPAAPPSLRTWRRAPPSRAPPSLA